ncbi:MAG TPA: nuclease-related domain-containing protein [Gammaproteobacteria bacterium]
MELFDLTQQQMIHFGTALLGAVVVITLLIWIVRYLRNTAQDRRIVKIIKEQSETYAKNITLSDGIYGYLFIDYLVLMKGKIIALDVHHLEGYIFGADQIEEWAQVINSKSYKFKNPLYRVRLIVQQIKQMLPYADVDARVLFGTESSFPKGVPEGVMRFDTFREELGRLNKNDYMAESMSKIWQELMGIAKQHKQQYLRETQEARKIARAK